MSLAWGGHANGQIPLSQLEGIGLGALPGGMQFNRQQYVHPTVAAAWRALVKAVAAETGVRLRVTEGYRSRSLQQYYWDLLYDPDLTYQKAAWPGTSSHGWARAIDMYGYTVAALKTVREIGPSFGWSLATGDRVNEPWHIEYTASLTSPPDFADGGETEEIDMPLTKADAELVAQEVLAVFQIKHPGVDASTNLAGQIQNIRRDSAAAAERALAASQNAAATKELLGALLATLTPAQIAQAVWAVELNHAGQSETKAPAGTHLTFGRRDAGRAAAASEKAVDDIAKIPGGSDASFTADDRQKLTDVRAKFA